MFWKKKAVEPEAMEPGAMDALTQGEPVAAILERVAAPLPAPDPERPFRCKNGRRTPDGSFYVRGIGTCSGLEELEQRVYALVSEAAESGYGFAGSVRDIHKTVLIFRKGTR